jgi:hypothetical protein
MARPWPHWRESGRRAEVPDHRQRSALFAPGTPREDYFRELASISAEGRHLSEDEWTELFARHDQYRA